MTTRRMTPYEEGYHLGLKHARRGIHDSYVPIAGDADYVQQDDFCRGYDAAQDDALT